MASPALATNYCPKCGVGVGSGDRFCRSCGAQIEAVAGTNVATVEAQPAEKKKNDSLLAVRVVLLIATGISAFTAPWLVTAGLALAWIVTLALPNQK